MMCSDEIRSKLPTDLPDGDSVGSGHRRRLRERMEKEGWDALKPHEMLELMLYPSLPRQDLSDLARLLVDRFGSLGGVLEAPREELESVPGVTPALAEWVRLTGGIMRAYCDLLDEEELRLSCFGEIRRFLEGWHPGDETGMWVLFLDFGFNLITFDRLGSGGDWWAPANARRLASAAVATGARCAVFVRFLDGETDIDEAGLSHLGALSCTMSALDVDIIDCVLAGGGRFRSLNVEGRLDDVRRQLSDPALFDRYLRES